MQNASAGRLCITLQHGKEFLWSHVQASIVDLEASVELITVLFVIEGAREGILIIVSDIVEHHDDDVIGAHAILDQQVVGVGNISLVAIVPVSVRASNEHGSMILDLGNSS